ncbi:CAAX prenyl protease [Chytriomyces hyalinus]|nr:CAAX prenyl protease [Chytriomyces hyalinus]
MLKQVLSHTGTKWIAIGWTAFIAENVIVSENRETLVGALGEDRYRMAYGFLSTAACSSIAYGYLVHGHHKGPSVVPYLGGSPAVKLTVVGLQALGLAGLMQALPKLQIPIGLDTSSTSGSSTSNSSSTPTDPPTQKFKMLCPVDFAHARNSDPNQLELKRITRHPQLFSFALFTLGTALSTPFLTTRLLTGFPIVFAVIGGAHQDARFLRSGAFTQEYMNETSLIPFWALVTGKQKWSDLCDEVKWVNAGVGLLGALLLAKRRGVLRL